MDPMLRTRLTGKILAELFQGETRALTAHDHAVVKAIHEALEEAWDAALKAAE